MDRLEEEIFDQSTRAEPSIGIGISIEYAFYPEEGRSLDELLYVADQKMYKAKTQANKVLFKEQATSTHNQTFLK